LDALLVLSAEICARPGHRKKPADLDHLVLSRGRVDRDQSGNDGNAEKQNSTMICHDNLPDGPPHYPPHYWQKSEACQFVFVLRMRHVARPDESCAGAGLQGKSVFNALAPAHRVGGSGSRSAVAAGWWKRRSATTRDSSCESRAWS